MFLTAEDVQKQINRSCDDGPPVDRWSDPGALCRPQLVNKMQQGECLYRDQRCHSPWASLFIWAVLQNRSEMAVYFWEMVRLTWDTFCLCGVGFNTSRAPDLQPVLSLCFSVRPGSRCWALWAAVSCSENFLNLRVRRRTSWPWRSWLRGSRTWLTVSRTTGRTVGSVGVYREPKSVVLKPRNSLHFWSSSSLVLKFWDFLDA